MSLRALLDARCAAAPDAIAVEPAGRPGEGTTWTALREQARAVAAALVRDGVAPGERVVLVARNDVSYFPILFGGGLAAAVLTPLNWRLATDELISMIDDSGTTVVLVDEPVAAALADVLSGRRVVVLGDVPVDGDASWRSFTDWVGPAQDPERPVAPEDVAFQLYTSGTTGRPKGAMFANGTNLAVLVDEIATAWGFRDGDVSLVAMPLFHMGGLAWALAGMARGARAVVVADFVPAAVLDAIEAHGVTTAFCVPTMLAALCAVPGVDSRPLGLRQMIYSGSPIGEDALKRAMVALRCDFVQIYGLTEATGAFAQLSAAEHREGGAALTSAGRPYPWVEVAIVDPETGDEVPDGAIGEIRTRSVQNMVGYWRRPEETAAALNPAGWLRTGDLGRLDDTGRIHLVDRAGDRIVTGGENVYPAEVERVLAQHADVAEVAVIGVPDERWGEAVKAVIVPAGAAPDPADVLAFARARLAGFQSPKSVDVVDTLPRTATGKVIKPTLREPYWRGHDRRIH
ncbi:AMP-binding protein [Actinomycetospora aeridis]|uniref:AMP-binding protein n=1 Tax=Actinomycetospora aeridis TaxID=3129231 RepID=A0ABU8N0U0_9PSEU